MRASRYQQYLGLPQDVVAPDYYQLLGVERGLIDPVTMDATIREREGHLQKAEDQGAASFLRREIEEAKATLTDPVRREAYDELLVRRRVGELKQLVPSMLENNELSSAAERAITDHIAAAGMDPRKIAAAIGERLRDQGVARGSHDEPSPEAARIAVAQLRIALRQLADLQLEAAMKSTGLEPRRQETRRKTAPVPAVRKETARRPAPAAETIEARVAREMTELNERIAELEGTKAVQAQTIAEMEPVLERIQRRSRRAVRSLSSGLAMALAFAAGHLARLLPGVGAKIDEVTAEPLAAHGSWSVGGTVGGAAVALFLWIIIASAFEKRAWFLVPAIALMLAAGAAGAVLMR